MAVTILENLNLQIKKVQVLKNNTEDNSYKFKSYFTIKNLNSIDATSLRDSAQGLSLYFFVLSEEQYQEFYNLLTSSQRLRLIKNFEDRNLRSVLSHQKNYYKKSLLQIIQENKSSLEKDQPVLNFSVSHSCRPSSGTSSYHLVSFIDRAASNRESLSSGKVAYEKILEKSNNSASYITPRQREEFFIDDKMALDRNGMPYSGPYHYHSEANPGKSGYVGWMAGHPEGAMGFKLKKEKVKNYKIQDLRNLKINLQEVIQLKPRTLYQSTGTDLEKKTLNQNKAKRSNNFIAESVNNSIQANMSKIGMYVTRDTELTSHVRLAPGRGTEFLNNSYFGSIISVDKFLICQNNTALGPFMNFHRRVGNDSIAMMLMNSSRILNFSVIRRKISDTSFEKKKKLGATEIEFEGDYAERRIISTTEQSGLLRSAINSRCSIEEVEVVNPITSEGNRDVRSVSLKDYDLYHNYESGMYTYDVEITLEDGSEKFIKKLYDNYRKSRLDLEAYFESMNTPATFDSNGNVTVGRYNYETNDSEIMSNQAIPRVRLILDKMSKQISGAYTFLTGRTRRDLDLDLLLSPQVYDPDIASLLSIEVRKIEKEILRILNSVSPARKTQSSAPSFKRNHVRSSASGLRGLVFVKNPTNIVHDLDSMGGIVADCGNEMSNTATMPSIVDVFSDQMQLESLSSPGTVGSSELRMEPSRFIEVAKMKYDISQENLVFSKSSTVQPKLPLMSNNPSIKVIQSTKTVTSGIKEITSKANFLQLGDFQKSNLITKISSIKAMDQSPGMTDHTDDYYANSLLKGKSGISIDMATDEVEDFETPPGVATVRAQIANSIPDLSESVLDGLVQSFYTSSNREDLDAQIQDKFKELISVKHSLGAIYDELGNNLQAESQKFINKIKEKDYEKVFLKGSDSQVSDYNYRKESREIFKEESFHAILIVPGESPKRISVSEMVTMIRASSRPRMNKVSFIKFVSNKPSNIKLINNGITLRI